MKRFLLLLLPLASLTAAPVEWGDQETPPEETPSYPFSLGGSYANICPATFYTPGFTGDTLHYTQSDANFSYTHSYDGHCGLIFNAGWVGTNLDWEENPDFHETNFNYVNLSAGGFSRVYNNWLWTLNLALFLDTQQFSLADYTLYQGLLWGKYYWSDCLEIDLGGLIELGLNQTKVWPILGFIYHFSSRLHLHAIYPLDMTLEYNWLPKLTAAGSLRIFRNHHRVDANEPLPQAIFTYQTWGGEFSLKYIAAPWFFIKGFVGSTAQGALRISNSNNTNRNYYKFNGSLYAGINSALSF